MLIKINAEFFVWILRDFVGRQDFVVLPASCSLHPLATLYHQDYFPPSCLSRAHLGLKIFRKSKVHTTPYMIKFCLAFHRSFVRAVLCWQAASGICSPAHCKFYTPIDVADLIEL